jgi:tetratricopeptide (TPR) repeat protein
MTPRLSILCLAFCLGAMPTLAETLGGSAAYRSCMDEARKTPERGLETASAWAALGGGEAARHCQAVAFLGLKHYVRGAESLERLAQDIRATKALKATLLGQAAQAWLLAGRPARADVVLTEALRLAPDDVELRMDRAQALAARGGFKAALADLDRARALAPERADILVFRGSALRHLGEPEKALADLERALALDPAQPEGLLERGILKRLAGDKDGARLDWLRVLETAADTPAGEAARANLQKMDGPGG